MIISVSCIIGWRKGGGGGRGFRKVRKKHAGRGGRKRDRRKEEAGRDLGEGKEVMGG